jgi:hypothetical protein
LIRLTRIEQDFSVGIWDLGFLNDGDADPHLQPDLGSQTIGLANFSEAHGGLVLLDIACAKSRRSQSRNSARPNGDRLAK